MIGLNWGHSTLGGGALMGKYPGEGIPGSRAEMGRSLRMRSPCRVETLLMDVPAAVLGGHGDR